ncbi:MAG: cysteine hydrolase family protein [Isosphaeraceae bacterium]
MLHLPDSTRIHANLARLTEYARRNGIPVLATSCAHTEEDAEEIARFGRHCMVGSPGQARIKATEWPGGEVIGSEDRFGGWTDAAPPAHLTLEKRAYDLFTHPEADRIVAAYQAANPTFVVYGVATDFCVRAAVLGLRARGCAVAVVVDAIHAIDVAHEIEVLDEFTAAGAVLTLTDVVCGR